MAGLTVAELKLDPVARAAAELMAAQWLKDFCATY